MTRRLAVAEPGVVVPWWKTSTFKAFVAGFLTATGAAFKAWSEGVDPTTVFFGWLTAIIMLAQQVFTGQESQKASARAVTAMRGGPEE